MCFVGWTCVAWLEAMRSSIGVVDFRHLTSSTGTACRTAHVATDWGQSLHRLSREALAQGTTDFTFNSGAWMVKSQRSLRENARCWRWQLKKPFPGRSGRQVWQPEKLRRGFLWQVYQPEKPLPDATSQKNPFHQPEKPLWPETPEGFFRLVDNQLERPLLPTK